MRKKHINASLVMFYLLNCGMNTAMHIVIFFLNIMCMYVYIMCAYYTYTFNFIYDLCHDKMYAYILHMYIFKEVLQCTYLKSAYFPH